MKGTEIKYDAWETDNDGPWVTLRLFSINGPPGNGHMFRMDPAGALAMSRAIEREAGAAAIVETRLTAEAEKRNTRRRNRLFGRA